MQVRLLPCHRKRGKEGKKEGKLEILVSKINELRKKSGEGERKLLLFSIGINKPPC